MSSRPVLLTAAVLIACLALIFWGSKGAPPAEFLLELSRRETLEQHDEVIQRVSAGKHQVTAEVLAGRLTLREAAERFRQLDALLDDRAGEARGLAPRARTEEERCRYVLHWVASAGPEEPARAASVVARLEEEYRQRFGRDPEPPPTYPPAP
jgi:hypothetical protein